MIAKARAVAALTLLCTVTTLACTMSGARAVFLSNPTDLRQHADYDREWWSLSGRAATSGGRQFRWQASFFRFALADTEQLYTAEFSVLDVSSGKLESRQRSARELFASAARQSSSIAVDDWRLVTRAAHDLSRARVDVDLGSAAAGLSLRLLPQKPPVPSLAFHGYAVTRLAATGRLIYAGTTYLVRGAAWLDHEYETAPANERRVGWERFELQLDDGRDIELFTSRLPDGNYRLSSHSGASELGAQQTIVGRREPMDGLSIDRRGRAHRLSPESIELIVRANTHWHSPHDDAMYPALWQVTLGGEATVAIVPTARDQEVLPEPRGVAVWYGAVDLAQADPPGLALGTGFVELTGYVTPTRL